jgi:hypothetical protein
VSRADDDPVVVSLERRRHGLATSLSTAQHP